MRYIDLLNIFIVEIYKYTSLKDKNFINYHKNWSIKNIKSFIITYINGFSPTTGVGTFTMKSKGMDVDESQVYQELLCFSSNSQHDWPSTEKVSVVCNLNV